MLQRGEASQAGAYECRAESAAGVASFIVEVDLISKSFGWVRGVVLWCRVRTLAVVCDRIVQNDTLRRQASATQRPERQPHGLISERTRCRKAGTRGDCAASCKRAAARVARLALPRRVAGFSGGVDVQSAASTRQLGLLHHTRRSSRLIAHDHRVFRLIIRFASTTQSSFTPALINARSVASCRRSWVVTTIADLFRSKIRLASKGPMLRS